MPMREETIAAIASPAGSGERGVIRVSGPLARELVRATVRTEAAGDASGPGAVPELGQRAALRGLFDDGTGRQPLLLLWMPAPHSFTRRDVAEFHLPGAAPLLAAAFARLLALGARPARPGEFTQQAFLCGRIDLARAEGVLALVNAENESERRASAGLLFGGLSRRTAALRDELESLRALCEASLDFDESDTGHVPRAELDAARAALERGLADALAWETARAAERGTPRIVLAGLPNAGKSALFNALAGAERALESPQAGTTRDLLEAELELAGTACRLVDGAGLDARLLEADPDAGGGEAGPSGAYADSAGADADLSGADDGAGERAIERRAQALARDARAAADVVVWVVDASDARDPRPELAALGLAPQVPVLVAWNKIDRASAAPAPPAAWGLARWWAVSARAGTGLDALRAGLAAALDAPPERGAGGGALARELAQRHQAALGAARDELARGFEAWSCGAPLELLAEHLRAATAALDRISGTTTGEDLLDRIFARFCLGK